MISLLKLIFKRQTQRILLLGEQSLACYVWIKGDFQQQIYAFSKDEAGYQQFVRYLSKAPNIPTTFIVDMPNEIYQEGYIPHLFKRGDRKAVIKRRLARLFHNEKYCHADLQGRQSDGRRDDSMLFTALRDPDVLEFWLSAFTSLAIPLRAICSLPLLSSQLLPALVEPAPKHLLLTSVHSISGLRQSYFKSGQLKLSRLVTLPYYDVDKYVDVITAEVTAIHLYLENNRSLSEKNPLAIYILAAGELKDRLAEKMYETKTNTYHIIDINALASAHGFYTPKSHPFSDGFFVNFIYKQKIKNHYAAEKERKYFKQYQLQKGVFALSALLIPIALFYSAFNLFEHLQIKQSNVDLEAKISTYQALYAKAQKKLPDTPIPPDELELVDNMVGVLVKRYQGDPFWLLNPMSQVLANFPDILVRKIIWTKEFSPMVGEVPDQKNLTTGTEIKYYQTATLEAEIVNFAGSIKNIDKEFKQFLNDLRAVPAVYHVEEKKSPAIFDHDSNLRGSTQISDLNTEFIIEIFMKIEDGSI